MKCHFLLLSVFSTILVSTHSFDGALEKMRNGSASPNLSNADTMQGSEALMDDSVPVLYQPEVMISTLPMRTESVAPSQMVVTDPLMTEAVPNQMMTESSGKNTAEETMPKPAMTDEEASGRGWSQTTASDVLKKIYDECVQHGSFACVKPKVLSFLSAAVKKDKILLTDDLVIEKTGRRTETYEFEEPQQVGSASSHFVYIYTAWCRVM
jgi:hypothetical protein